MWCGLEGGENCLRTTVGVKNAQGGGLLQSECPFFPELGGPQVRRKPSWGALAIPTQVCLLSLPLLGPSCLWASDYHGFSLLLEAAGSQQQEDGL